MGNRVKGRPKKSSIKAALGSNAGSKRKLSRMGKKQKRNHSGLEATFIGRSQCLKRLQINIKDFRRLCILKGIYPREPLGGKVPGKKKGQTFYHVKDIRAIAHEPVLEKFREFRAFMKKVRRAAGRNEKDEALRKNAVLPSYTLQHLVKERYPRFQDALADLDDALTLTYLFASLPAAKSIKPKAVAKAKTLAAAWGAYCATTSSISKSFISVKGVYMEASVENVEIRWIIPHAFTQYMPDDVDFRVMNTFFEFYETMLNFILFKLYSDIGVRYPLLDSAMGIDTAGSTSSILGTNLQVLTKAMSSQNGIISSVVDESAEQEDGLKKPRIKTGKKSKELIETIGAALNKLQDDDGSAEEASDDDDEEQVDVAGPLQAALQNADIDAARSSMPGVTDNLSEDAEKRKLLFQNLTFFLSREVPRGYIELVCLAYGGKVGWEGADSPISMKDPTITHHIVDRPVVPSSYSSLPKSREFVQPQWALDCTNFMFLLPITRYTVGTNLPPHLSPWADAEEEGYTPKYAEDIERMKNGEAVELSDEEVEKEAAPVEKIDGPDSDNDESMKEESEEEDDETLEARKQKKRKKIEEEEHRLAKTMMSRKATHLYGRMQHGISKKQTELDKLKNRRKVLDSMSKDPDVLKGKEKADSGKTMLKQKVERLKNERKSIGAKYGKSAGSMKKSSNKRRKSTETDTK